MGLSMSEQEERYIDIEIGDLLEIELPSPENFLKVKETLTRIGVCSNKDKKLWQSCHILHKRGKYYITHFKELFALDGLPTNFNSEDLARRNKIATLLQEWGLLNIVVPSKALPVCEINQIKILPHSEKKDWTLEPKYHIGKDKGKRN
jgi:hypothetical protein